MENKVTFNTARTDLNGTISSSARSRARRVIILGKPWDSRLLNMRAAKAGDDAGLKTIDDDTDDNKQRECQADPRGQAA